MKINILSIIILLLICTSVSAYEPIEELKPRAETGDAQAQYDLAARYEVGYWGVSKDEALALKWYRLAAAQGHQAAKGALSVLNRQADAARTAKPPDEAAVSTTTAAGTAKPSVAPDTFPLHDAVMKNDLATVTALLAQGMDVNARDASEFAATPLHYAGNCDLEVTELLLSKGADVNAKTARSGETPLGSAARGCHRGLMGLLLKNGANVNEKDAYGLPSLHYVAVDCNGKVVQLLLTNGANVNAKDANGWMPLHKAVKACNGEAIPLLLANGANVNAKTEDGWTPLDIAVQACDGQVVQWLLDKGGVESQVERTTPAKAATDDDPFAGMSDETYSIITLMCECEETFNKYVLPSLDVLTDAEYDDFVKEGHLGCMIWAATHNLIPTGEEYRKLLEKSYRW